MHNHIEYVPHIFISAKPKENCDSNDSVSYRGEITAINTLVVEKHWESLRLWITEYTPAKLTSPYVGVQMKVKQEAD